MSLTQVSTPFPIFTDLDGSPLDNGYLYIGQVNQNPETNPIQIYWDSDMSQPAPQPIRTNNGYPWRQGTPALIYASSAFSITVKNKKNELVIYAPYGFGSIVLGQENFTGDGTTVSFSTQFSFTQAKKTDVYISGVYQNKNTYTFSGNSIVFTEAPPDNSIIEINYA